MWLGDRPFLGGRVSALAASRRRVIPVIYFLLYDSVGPMPEIRSLRTARMGTSVVPWMRLLRCEALALQRTNYASLRRHSQSLTELILDSISFEGGISSQMDFLSLTHLSLVAQFNAACLVTCHESGSTKNGSFPTPLPSLVILVALFFSQRIASTLYSMDYIRFLLGFYTL